MQLTPLQLEIQQRADKTLSFGCIVEYKDYEDYKGEVLSHTLAIREYIGDHKPRSGLRETTDGIGFDKIIGHPMNWGRLCSLADNHNMDSPREWYDVQTFLLMFPACYQQTVLERPTFFQELVLAFLNTLGPL